MKVAYYLLFLALLVLYLSSYQAAAAEDFQVSLTLQRVPCTDSLTLVCTHSYAPNKPNWVHNGTSAGSVALGSIPGAVYTESTTTRHVAVISGRENVTAVDSFTFQCLYDRINGTVKSNKVEYFWGYAEESNHAIYDTGYCNYNCTIDCSMALLCEQYANISVTSLPNATTSSTSSPKWVNYTISDLVRCQSYAVQVMAQVGAHKYTNHTEDTVMLGPGCVEIVNAKLFAGEEESELYVVMIKNQSDCPDHKTETYTFFIDNDQVGNVTAAKFGLSSFITEGDMAEVKLMVPAEKTNSSRFNVTVMLSNTVTFMEIITSSLNGVNSTQKSQQWTSMSAPYYCENCNDFRTNTSADIINYPLYTGIAVGVIVVILFGIIIPCIIVVYCKRRAQSKAKNTALLEPKSSATAVFVADPTDAEQEMQLETKDAGHQIVYATIEQKNQRPIPSPPNELYTGQYATIGHEGQ